MFDDYISWNDPRYDGARTLHVSGGLLDLHVDTIIANALFGYDVRKRHPPGIPGQPILWHADLPRMRDARYAGACMGIHYWPWESENGWRSAMRQIDYLDQICAADAHCLRVREPADWKLAMDDGKLGLAAGMEGAHMLNGRLERVAEMAARGVVYLTLAHFSKNLAATPSIGRGANEEEGLSQFGTRLVEELNRHGVVVDVAHVNTPGVLDACAVTKVPIFCTHTGVKGVYPSARNITDEEIDAIAETGGAIGMIFGPNFLAGRLRADTEVVLDHACYVLDRVGAEHLAIGSDYDGWLPSILSDHRDCRDVVKVTDGLRRRGVSDADVELILGGNARRVIEEVWEAREVGSTARAA